MESHLRPAEPPLPPALNPAGDPAAQATQQTTAAPAQPVAQTTDRAARRGARAIFDELPQIVSRDPPEAREEALWSEIQSNNFPTFAGTFVPLVIKDRAGRRATFQVTVDCFAVGTDDDWLRIALSGYYAQKVADHLGAFLPTNRIVLAAFEQATVKLAAHPFDCQSVGQGAWQRSTFAMRLHEDILQGRVACQKGIDIPEASGRLKPMLGAHTGTCALPTDRHPGVLVAGHLKEIILSHEDLSKRLAFWGFFAADGRPYQHGFGCAHGPGFADYSHGFRLVGPLVDIDGQSVAYEEVITNPAYAELAFAEGGQPCGLPRYPAPPSNFYMGR